MGIDKKPIGVIGLTNNHTLKNMALISPMIYFQSLEYKQRVCLRRVLILCKVDHLTRANFSSCWLKYEIE